MPIFQCFSKRGVFSNYKSFCLRVWFPISLNLGVKSDSPFWDTDRSWDTFDYWEPLTWAITKFEEKNKS